jgi:hypothetical protein
MTTKYCDVVNGVVMRGPNKNLRGPYLGKKLEYRELKPILGRFQRYDNPVVTEDENSILFTFPVVDRDYTADQFKPVLIQKVDIRQHQKELSGIDFNGLQVPTTETAITKLQAALGRSVSRDELTVKRKINFSNGVRAELDASELDALLDQIDVHIQSCQDWAFDLLADIEAATTVDELKVIEGQIDAA